MIQLFTGKTLREVIENKLPILRRILVSIQGTMKRVYQAYVCFIVTKKTEQKTSKIGSLFSMTSLKTVCLFLSVFCIISKFAYAGSFSSVDESFDSFLKCEIKASFVDQYFEGAPYEIEYIRFYEDNPEGDITVLTGAVKCMINKKDNVSEKKIIVYIAIGLTQLLGNKEVSYFYSSTSDFKILATGLMRFPYKGDCKWQRFALTP